MAKRRITGGNVVADINVTPMADVMLVLLIIFMITTPLLQSGISLSLPKAKNPLAAPEADSNDAVMISVNRAGQVYQAKRQMTDNELIDFLMKTFAERDIQSRSIFLRADGGVLYGRVVEVVNKCREAGVDRIGLMTEKEKEE